MTSTLRALCFEGHVITVFRNYKQLKLTKILERLLSFRFVQSLSAIKHVSQLQTAKTHKNIRRIAILLIYIMLECSKTYDLLDTVDQTL